MNDIAALREYGPEAGEVNPQARDRARTRLLTEIASESPMRRRWTSLHPRWSTGRRTLGYGLAAGAALAVVAGIVIVAIPKSHTAREASDVHLVAFDMPVFPVGLGRRPTGLAAPTFSGGRARGEVGPAGFSLTAVYQSTAGTDDIYLGVDNEYAPQAPANQIKTTSVNGTNGYLVENEPRAGVSMVVLTWQRQAGQWITLTGNGRFASKNAVLKLAADIVDEPQPVPLQIHLAPAGWRLVAFKDNNILALGDPYSDARLTVHLVDRPDEQLSKKLTDVRRIESVQVQGRVGQLARTIDGWFLQAPLLDGSAFQLQAPAELSSREVIAIADQVSVDQARR